MKPDNILIMQDDPILVKITDFGLAKFSDNLTFMKTFVVHWRMLLPKLSPVSMDHRRWNCNKRTTTLPWLTFGLWDVLVYVLLTSHLPFNGKNQQQMFAKIKGANFMRLH